MSFRRDFEIAPPTQPQNRFIAGQGNVHGSAHWMDGDEAAKIELKKPGGVLLGQSLKGDKLFFHGDGHVMVFSPTGAGKGIGFVQPNLHDYAGSMVVLDPKGENTIVSAKHRRRMGQKVIVLDPFGITDEPTDTYNPLGALTFADGAQLGPMIEALSDALITTKEEKDRHWTDGGRKFASMLMWWLVAHEPPEKRNLVRLYELAHGGYDQLSKVATVLSEGRSHDPDIARVCRAAGNWFLSRQRREFSYFESVASNHIGWIGDFVWSKVLGGPPSPPLPLKTLRQGVTVYLALPFERMDRYQSWLRLMVADLFASLYSTPGQPVAGVPVLFMLDEAFAGLGRMEVLLNAAAAIRSAGARLVLIYQDMAQPQKVFGPEGLETLMENSGIRLFWSVNGQKAKEFLSRECGQRTEPVPGNPVGMPAPLIRPEAVGLLPPDEIIGLFRNTSPAKFGRLNVRTDGRFSGLAPNKTYGQAKERTYTARTDYVPVDLGAVNLARRDFDDDRAEPPARSGVKSRLQSISEVVGLQVRFLEKLEQEYGAELVLRGDELGYYGTGGTFEVIAAR